MLGKLTSHNHAKLTHIPDNLLLHKQKGQGKKKKERKKRLLSLGLFKESGVQAAVCVLEREVITNDGDDEDNSSTANDFPLSGIKMCT